MLDKLTYSQKNYLILGGFILTLILVYVLNFSKTIDLYLTVSQSEKEIENVSSYPKKITMYSTKLKELNRVIESFVKDDDFGQEEILEEVSSFCNNNRIKIRQFPVSTMEVKGDILLENYSFVVDGSFKNILKLIDNLENKKKIGKITSVKMEKIKERRTKRIKLYATIYLQNIRK